MNQLNKVDTQKKLIINFRTVIIWFLVFSFAIISVGGVSAIPYNLRMPLIMATGVITAAFILFKRKKIYLAMPISLILLAVVYIAISVLYTIDKDETTKLAIVYLCSSLLLLAEYPESLYEKAIKVIQISCIVFAFSIILSSFIDNLMIDYFWFIVNPSKDPQKTEYIIKEIEWGGSYSGFALEKAEAAFIMNVGISIYISKYFTQRKFTVVDLFFLIILFWALILTSKRMLFLCPIATICVMMLISRKKGRFLTFVPVVLLLLCVVVVAGSALPQTFHLFERFTDTDSIDELSGRVYLWPYCIEMLKESPIFGLGIGTFNTYLYAKNVMIDGKYWVYYGHNIYYEFLGELGILGFLLLFGGLVLVLYRTISLVRTDLTTDSQKYLLGFSVSIQIICFIYCASGNVLIYPQQIFIWFMCLGITATISNRFKKNKIRLSKRRSRSNFVWR